MARLGRYELGGLLGRGGAGEVYAATLVGPGGFRKEVALKVLHAGSEELRREARITGLLRHRHLVDVYEIGEEDGRWYCALERCEGSLAPWVPLPPRAVVEVGLQVCEALQYAHEELGLVHLDLKPSNLLYDRRGVVKVGDLGIAEAEGFGRARQVRGTPAYMAPEQRYGDEVDARTDIYALGVTLLELATGHTGGPSGTVDVPETMVHAPPLSSHTMEGLFGLLKPPDPGPASDEAPPWLAPVLGRCLAEDPHDRWPSMAAFAEALRGVRVSGPGLAETLGLAEVDAAPLPTPDGNLELSEPDPFVGRGDDLERLAGQLQTPGVLTLKGPAGVGKSRLAAAAARRWRTAHSGSAWFCDLTAVHTRDGLLSAIGRMLGVATDASAGAETLGHAVASKGSAVVVLDNFEQILDQSAVVQRWAELAPSARWLVTSRAPLGVAAERVVEVAPLPADEAQQLLVARARERGAEVAGAPGLADLATRLDGLPLALELAAGRLGVLSVDDVLARLDAGILRDARDARHASLQAALDWSWDLLTPEQQTTLAQLSVFEGGFTLEAAEAVVVHAPVLDAVEALVTGSLVHRSAPDRFDLLVSIRSYATARLDDREAVEARHGRWVVAGPASPASVRQLDRLGRVGSPRLMEELDNVVAAARRAVQRQDVAVAVQAVDACVHAFLLEGPGEVGIELVEAALALPGLSVDQRARLEYHAGQMVLFHGDPVAAEARFQHALTLTRRGSGQEEGEVLSSIGFAAARRGDWERAATLFDRAMRSTDPERRGYALIFLASCDLAGGRFDVALQRFEEALPLVRAHDNPREEARLLANKGVTHLRLGQEREAAEALTEAVRLSRQVGHRRREAFGRRILAKIDRVAGRRAEARRQLEAVVQVNQDLGNRRGVGAALQDLGALDLEDGDRARASERLARAVEVARARQDPASEGAALSWLAVATEDPVRARERLHQARSLLEGASEDRWCRHELHTAEVALRGGDRNGARGALARAEALVSSDPELQHELERVRDLLSA